MLRRFQRANLDRPRRKRTFMEVAGIERREVTVSRVLAFLLDTETEHGMSNLWLDSLLSAASESDDRFDPEALQAFTAGSYIAWHTVAGRE